MMEDNVPGFSGYHVTRSGNVYSRRVERSPNKFKISLRKKRRLDKLIKLGRSRIYIGKRLKVSRKTIYNSLHRG